MNLGRIIQIAAEVIYSPVYAVSWILHIIARFFLGVSYFGMLKHRTGADVIRSLFKWR